MNFKEWLNEYSNTPKFNSNFVVRNRQNLLGPSGHFDAPVNWGDVIPIKQGISSIATGIGANFRQAMYPTGRGEPVPAANIIPTWNSKDNTISIQARLPLRDTEKETVQAIRDMVETDMAEDFLRNGIDPRFGTVSSKRQVGKDLLVVLKYPARSDIFRQKVQMKTPTDSEE